MFKSLGTSEIIILIAILLVIFGSQKIMEWARRAGEVTKEIKGVKKEYTDTVQQATSDIDVDIVSDSA